MVPESLFVISICGLTVSVVLLRANILGEMSTSETCVPVKTGCMFYKNLKYFNCLFSPNESQKISKYFCLLLVLVGCGTGILCFVRWDELFHSVWSLPTVAISSLTNLKTLENIVGVNFQNDTFGFWWCMLFRGFWLVGFSSFFFSFFFFTVCN